MNDIMYLQALERAQTVYEDRNELYQDLWRSAPRERQLEQMRHKMDRIAFLSKAGRACEDDTLDLINYCAFFTANGHTRSVE